MIVCKIVVIFYTIANYFDQIGKIFLSAPNPNTMVMLFVKMR